MRPILLLAIFTVIGCYQPKQATFDLAVVNMPSTNPDHRETQIQFDLPEEAYIEVISDGQVRSSMTVDRLNSAGTFKVELSVTRNAPSENGKHTFTTSVLLESPTDGLVGGPSTYTFNSDKSLDDILEVTAVPTVVPFGVPHTVGSLNGEPITLLVKPTVMKP